MALMYDMAAVNASMVNAAEVCRQDLPEGEKVNKVLACFAGMKPVEAEPVVHAKWEFLIDGYYCSECDHKIRKLKRKPKYCERCGARMDAKEVEE